MKVITNEKVLRTPSEPVTKAKGLEIGRELIKFANEWNETHKQQRAIGLAAPQVGIFKQVCIIKLNGRFLIFVNPVIVGHSEATVEWKEKCISLPGKEVETVRWIWTTVQTENFGLLQQYGLHESNLSTTRQAFDLVLENVAVQHEVDHLNAILITDRAAKKLTH